MNASKQYCLETVMKAADHLESIKQVAGLVIQLHEDGGRHSQVQIAALMRLTEYAADRLASDVSIAHAHLEKELAA